MYNPPRESSSETLHTSTPTDLRLIRAAVFIIKEIRCIQQTFGLYGRRLGWDDLRKQHQNMYIIKGETDHQPRLNAWDKCSGLLYNIEQNSLCYRVKSLLVIHFTCSSVYMSVPNSITIPSSSHTSPMITISLSLWDYFCFVTSWFVLFLFRICI